MERDFLPCVLKSLCAVPAQSLECGEVKTFLEGLETVRKREDFVGKHSRGKANIKVFGKFCLRRSLFWKLAPRISILCEEFSPTIKKQIGSHNASIDFSCDCLVCLKIDFSRTWENSTTQ